MALKNFFEHPDTGGYYSPPPKMFIDFLVGYLGQKPKSALLHRKNRNGLLEDATFLHRKTTNFNLNSKIDQSGSI